ncbi:MAG: hypothetical protein KAR13_04615 [Desulfobulbaceae bacterium]|nr:hypothetical protein [Desulfobulbaceae bacterium]
MRNMILTLLITFLLIAGLIIPEAMAAEEGIGVQTAQEVMAAQKVDRVAPNEDDMLYSVDKSDRVFTRLENTKIKIVSFFHRRNIGEAIVEKDFIRYQFDTETGELIEEKRQWRKGLPDHVTPVTTREQAESMVEGEATSSHLYIISPESEIFRIKPTPKNPCWVVWSIDGERQILTVIDAVTGKKLGYGIPPPYEGLSIHGPDHAPNCDNNAPLWHAHAQNAHDWFETMDYDTFRDGSATGTQVQNNIQSDTTVMFYELDHGGSFSFKNRCEDNILGTEIETWIADYASMGFAFIGSCEGMCSTGENTFTEEFRKGLDEDTVVVGYCGMSWDQCNDCWFDAIAWQTELFTRMNNGNSVGYAFSQANLAYPDCTDQGHNCMRIAGDTGLRFAGTWGGKNVPELRRSKCGAIYNAPPWYFFPLPSVASRTYTRAHHIRCNSYVPIGYWLTIGTSADYPYNELAFLNDSKLTVYGAYLSADGGSGEISFVSAQDRNKGMKFSGELKIYTGGEIKIYE